MQALKLLIGTAVVVAAGLGGLELSERFLASGPAQAALGPARDRDAEPLRVATVPAASHRFVTRVSAVGTTRAHRAISLLPDASGRITEILFVAGQSVEAGAPLLRLDDAVERATLKSAEATLEEARAAYDRQETLRARGAAADATWQSARAALLRAEAERDLAEVALQERTLRAPFAGVTGLTELEIGGMIDTSTIVTTLDDPSVIEAEFRVPETVMARLDPGLPVELTSAAYPGRVFSGGITGIDTRVDSQTRSILIRAAIENADAALTGGMFMEVSLLLEDRMSPAVPERALSVEGDRTMVHVARDGHAQLAELVTGQSADGLVEVLDGLEPGAQVIVSNLHRVSDGMAVAPAEPALPAAGARP
ncbi:efflux RND transporter periplasmic adaptor subunit [Mangrovicoccus algicola]|uniref:Efflux RND transporter periplasmic adaptor subunit n=1 Tax=Mangrovicoccus algicola TaxID=2771008 RepID=A0A8J7CGM8_9RHOB|nr:efflux RND transporter periplasmic adaptor subunit [Mangrovicoccus algicola]MBE3637275.1 efflux RND transporter periplasmic adaptor subunit [Mangrovicoccus algicola]